MGHPNYLLRNARLAKGISLRKFASLLGVDPTTLYRWEMGRQEPYPIHKARLAEFLGKSFAELGFTLEEGVISGQSNREGGNTRFFSSQPIVFAKVELVGRNYDFVAVRARLLTGRVALVGLPGVGKTSLALGLASDMQIRAVYPAGILWAHMGQKPLFDSILCSWCKCLLGLSPRKMARLPREKLVGTLQTAIGGQHMCLILDDVWASADARILLQVAGPNCGVLVTTRSPLIGTELANHQSYILNELDEEAGFQLFHQLAPQAVEREAEKARKLVRAAGGLPLALTLMGHFLANEASSGQTRRVAHALKRLSNANERLNIGEKSLRSVISLSENLLSEEARRAFHSLGLLPPKPERFSESTALGVAGCTTEILDTLVDLGLLEPADDDYLMHKTIHDYCQVLLSPTERRAAEERLLTFILGELDARATDPLWLDQEKQTILLAIDAAEHLKRHEELLHLTLLLAPFLITQGWLAQARTMLARACEVARRMQTAPELPRLLLRLGETLILLTSVEEGLAVYHEGLSVARRLHDEECTAEILSMLAWYAHIYGEYEQADSYIQEGLAIAIPRDLPNVLWVLYRVQGSQAWARGDYAQAEEAYLRGLNLVERLDDGARRDLCMYHCFLGVFEGERGHYAQAETYFQQGIVAAQMYGFRDFMTFILARRAMMRLIYDPSDDLREELEQGILAVQPGGSWGYAVYSHKALAQLELLWGNVDRAEEITSQVSEIIEASQMQNRLGEHRTILAQIELARGRYAEAVAYIQQALPLLRIYGAAEDKAIALLTLGELEIARGDLHAAEAAFRELFEVGPADFLAPLALGYFGRARLAESRHHYQEARQLGEKSLQMLEKLKYVRVPEIRAWLEQLPKSRFQALRHLRKRN